MRVDQLSASELINHVLCQPELSELEQALLNALEEKPDAEEEFGVLEANYEASETRIDDLNYSLEEIRELAGFEDVECPEKMEKIIAIVDALI